jgi:flagellin
MTIHRLNRLNSDFTSQAIERLSSGLRINRAADDAAGLSISESFTSQVRGTHQAIRNAQDGISMLRTAEGAFSTIHDVLQRMRELAVQGANGTLVLSDRLAIQAELEALKAQIDQTAYFTTFNGQKLLVNDTKVYNPVELTYTYSNPADPFGTWTAPNDTPAETFLTGPGTSYFGVSYDELQAAKEQLPYLLQGALLKAEATLINSGLNHATTTGGSGVPLKVTFVIDPGNLNKVEVANADELTVNLYSVYGTASPSMTLAQAIAEGMGAMLLQREDKTDAGAGAQSDLDAFSSTPGVYDVLRFLPAMAAGDTYLAYGKPGAAFDFEDTSVNGGRNQAAWLYRYLAENHGLGIINDIALGIVDDNTGNKANMVATIEAALLEATGFDDGAGNLDKTALEAAVTTWMAGQANPAPFTQNALGNTRNTSAIALDKTLTLQVGANFGETMEVSLFAGAIGNLDFAGMVNVVDQTAAQQSLTTLDRAIAMVSDARVNLGASENRLQATINRLSTYEESAAAAKSRIRDTDVADEMMNLTRGQIMSQASMGTLSTYQALMRDQVGAILESSL